MADTKYLILSMADEHDTTVAVVPIDENFQTRLGLRLRRLEDLHGEDDDLDEFVFSDAGDLWRIEDVFDWIEDNDEDALLEDRYWMVVDRKPPFSEDSRLGVSVCQLHLTRHGSYYWSFLPKHWETTYESASFRVGRDKIGE